MVVPDPWATHGFVGLVYPPSVEEAGVTGNRKPTVVSH